MRTIRSSVPLSCHLANFAAIFCILIALLYSLYFMLVEGGTKAVIVERCYPNTHSDSQSYYFSLPATRNIAQILACGMNTTTSLKYIKEDEQDAKIEVNVKRTSTVRNMYYYIDTTFTLEQLLVQGANATRLIICTQHNFKKYPNKIFGNCLSATREIVLPLRFENKVLVTQDKC